MNYEISITCAKLLCRCGTRGADAPDGRCQHSKTGVNMMVGEQLRQPRSARLDDSHKPGQCIGYA